MANPRARRKSRSSVSRVKQRAKSKKVIVSNPIIRASWNRKETTSQNFKRLGLATKLNGRSGGAERDLEAIRAAKEQGVELEGTHDSLRVSNPKSVGLTEAKVVRDPETGRILEVIQTDEHEARSNPLNDPLNDLDSDEEAEIDRKRSLANPHGHIDDTWRPKSSDASTEVIRKLQEKANIPRTKRERPMTATETSYLEALVRKHGEDYGRMARDIKTNYLQRTENNLRRAIEKWRAAGGTLD